MLIMYRGFELVPIKDGEKWQAQVFSGSKPVGATPLCTDEEAAARSEKDRGRLSFATFRLVPLHRDFDWLSGNVRIPTPSS
jgi:hypothetical protein